MPADAQTPWDWSSELRERELDRRAREIDRRERELERRERELSAGSASSSTTRRAGRWRCAARRSGTSDRRPPGALDATLLAERAKALEREVALEASLMRKVNEILEKDRQVMQMSDREVNEMMESSVGYLLQSDDDIADRVRFKAFISLQERLAMEAGLQPASGSGSLSLAWRLALGPSVVTEIRHNKALELLKIKRSTRAPSKSWIQNRHGICR
ncbi:hypothetical protein BJ912DRAFT_631670 [Pholiota molesta]|nr:hypothetical protein BJ912DRAFT_631670 [Pholiota molesta]